MGARWEEENYLKEKMAEKHLAAEHDGFGSVAGNQTESLGSKVSSATQSSKRCSSTSPGSSSLASTAPPHKSPRTDPPSPTTREPHPETDKIENPENPEGPSGVSVSPSARRKSWRRATLTRRSFPVLPNPYQVLCRSISTSLSHQERLERLMEASMRLAVERTQNSLQSVPNSSLERFQKQVEHMQKEWGYLAKSLHSKPQVHQLHASAASSCDPAVQRAVEKVQKTINRLEAESESWEALLNKHRSKAEEVERKVEQGQERGIALDSSCMAQSSQYLFIQSKPDYHGLLCRQQPKLHTIAVIMDTQCKMVRDLLSVKEQSQLLVKETSGRLAAEAGFQDLSPDPFRNLMAAPVSSATT
ncbi:kinetochore-associated protein DSN1 homolog [Hippoglossus stenolepis]|uniref:kinetochore-associated protein DSN1 homolog n=1 Tax=Hippoglossus stenolepis TaxID=195615 RepID=UPI001FB00B57|nr:kinetochore-associated protein DSN1 homolog [Hippoglossus stenolepis]